MSTYEDGKVYRLRLHRGSLWTSAGKTVEALWLKGYDSIGGFRLLDGSGQYAYPDYHSEKYTVEEDEVATAETLSYEDKEGNQYRFPVNENGCVTLTKSAVQKLAYDAHLTERIEYTPGIYTDKDGDKAVYADGTWWTSPERDYARHYAPLTRTEDL